jgi:hypothetical protein
MFLVLTGLVLSTLCGYRSAPSRVMDVGCRWERQAADIAAPADQLAGGRSRKLTWDSLEAAAQHINAAVMQDLSTQPPPN